MREHLLGYLLGALEEPEAETVRQTLESDEVLRRDLAALRRCLQPLSCDASHFDPPVGLAARTCNYVAAEVETTLVRVAPGKVSRWSFADMVVAATVLVASSAVFFPAMNQSRYDAQVAGCQNNLRQAGLAFAQFADANGGYMMASQPRSKKEAVAGYITVDMHEKGMIDGRTLVCPGSALASFADYEVPRLAQIRQATGSVLEALQERLSGSYGVPLGYYKDGELQPLRYLNRMNYALMSDAPNLKLASYQTSNHGARGQNVLFEDGHVRNMRTCRDCPYSDDVFHNDDGELAPGKHRDDSVIGPSDWPLEWTVVE